MLGGRRQKTNLSEDESAHEHKRYKEKSGEMAKNDKPVTSDENIEEPKKTDGKKKKGKKVSRMKNKTKDVEPTMVSEEQSEDKCTNESGEEDDHDKREEFCKKKIESEVLAINKLKFFHGLLPRDEIEALLKNDGQFLIRKTEVTKSGKALARLVISARWHNKVHHILPRMDKDGKWYFQPGAGFDTLQKMIDFYMVTKGEVQIEGTKLLTPLDRAEWYILHENLTIHKKLGAGSFGEVHVGDLIVDNKVVQVAVKTLKGQMGKTERAAFVREAAIQRRFKHEHVVSLLGVAPNQEPVMVVLEFCPGGQLKGFLAKKENKDLSVVALTKFLIDAAKGMEYLASLDVIHRDLAARNCLLTANECVKISDFGLSVFRKDLRDQKRTKMAIKWLAPEVLRDYQFSKATDVWAFGVLMWEVFRRCRSDPYPNMSNAEVRTLILEKKGRMEVPAAAPPHIQQLMRECWAELPYERPPFKDIVIILCGEKPLMPRKMRTFLNRMH